MDRHRVRGVGTSAVAPGHATWTAWFSWPARAAPRRSPRPDARHQTLAKIEHGSPFLAPAGALAAPWIAGVLSAVGSTLAVREPDAPSLLQAWPLLPAAVKPPVPATNLAQLGYSVDADTSPESLAAGQAHLGGPSPVRRPTRLPGRRVPRPPREPRAPSAGSPARTASPGFTRAA